MRKTGLSAFAVPKEDHMELKSFVRRNLKWVICGFFGILNLILMAIPYMAYCSYSVDVYSETYVDTFNAMRDGLSAYDMFDLGKLLGHTRAAAAGGAAGAFGVFALIVGLFMILICAAGILKNVGALPIPDKIGKFRVDLAVDIAFIATIALNVLILICISTVHGITLREAYIDDQKFTVGYSISAGVFFTLVFAAGAYAAMILLDKKLPKDPCIVTICSACGKRCLSKSAFCTECGAPTEKIKDGDFSLACEKCGRKARFRYEFCPVCGGRVVLKKNEESVKDETSATVAKEESVAELPVKDAEKKDVAMTKPEEGNFSLICEKCGRKALEGYNFCPLCGGRIVRIKEETVAVKEEESEASVKEESVADQPAIEEKDNTVVGMRKATSTADKKNKEQNKRQKEGKKEETARVSHPSSDEG